MTQSPTQTEIDHWHRFFAVECNNRAWALSDQVVRTPEEEREMVDAAYAAAFHWARIGTPANAGRADVLLAHVLSIAGQGETALAHARSALALFESGVGEDWDLAFAHAVMARAAAVMGDRELYAVHYAAARSAGGVIADEEDRAIFLAEFGKVPG